MPQLTNNMDDINLLVYDIKLIKEKKLEEMLTFQNIKNNFYMLKKGINLDNNHTCFYGFDDINLMVMSLNLADETYGIYLDNEFIGITSFGLHNPKDLTRREICLCLDEKYRNLGIGSICMKKMVDECFKNDATKCIHLCIIKENLSSRKVAEKLNFKEYTGYKNDSYIEDLDGNTHENVQYILKKKTNR